MIRLIEVMNYRCLKKVSQDLAGFQVLVGPNASGKSTFLDVIALLGDFVRDGLDGVLFNRAGSLDELFFNHHGDEIRLGIELKIPEKLQRTYSKKNAKSKTDIARYEVSFNKTKRGEIQIHGETLWIIDSNRSLLHNQSETEPTLFFPFEPRTPRILSKKKVHSPPGWRVVVKKQSSSGNDYFRAEKGETRKAWNIMFRVHPKKAALSSIPEDIDRFPIAIWVRNVLLEGVQVLALNSAAMRKAVSPSLSRKFSVSGDNLPLVIDNLKKNHDQAFGDWLFHIQTIFPDIQDVFVVERQDNRHLYLAVKYAGLEQSIPSWLLSDGTLRMLALTLLAYLPEHSIYLIEEPENGIHPKALEGVFQSLSSVYEGQVLLATHSPLLLGLTKREQLLCFAKNPSGSIAIVRGDQHPKLKEWKGQIELATLYAAGVLG